ncbi:hypothetical protein BwSH12_73650 [Bradyrhizobium ottawaense]|nr:hypothetical protein BwSH12_73650 [Bradyrhizobium ottawaense]
MLIRLAQTSKRNEDPPKVAPPPSPSLDLNSAEAAEPAEVAVDRYVPSRWSWGPAKSSFDW